MTKQILFILNPGELSLADLRLVWSATADSFSCQLNPGAYAAIDASAATVQKILARGNAAYGINTGFGLLAKTRIADDQLERLQRNLILSHSVGTGELLSDEVVRLILVMKIASLARGYSGVRAVVVDTLKALLKFTPSCRKIISGNAGIRGRPSHSRSGRVLYLNFEACNFFFHDRDVLINPFQLVSYILLVEPGRI